LQGVFFILLLNSIQQVNLKSLNPIFYIAWVLN
jgi:hypothetical protein